MLWANCRIRLAVTASLAVDIVAGLYLIYQITKRNNVYGIMMNDKDKLQNYNCCKTNEWRRKKKQLNS
jgi:hypothetical protein